MGLTLLELATGSKISTLSEPSVEKNSAWVQKEEPFIRKRAEHLCELILRCLADPPKRVSADQAVQLVKDMNIVRIREELQAAALCADENQMLSEAARIAEQRLDVSLS